MPDAGEGLVDAEARLRERIDERERERQSSRRTLPDSPARLRELESLRLAKAEMERQLARTAHLARRHQIEQALAEISRRIAAVNGCHFG